MHKICFTISFISCLYMFRAYVLIISRSKLHYTASGIITPIGGRLVHETVAGVAVILVVERIEQLRWQVRSEMITAVRTDQFIEISSQNPRVISTYVNPNLGVESRIRKQKMFCMR